MKVFEMKDLKKWGTLPAVILFWILVWYLASRLRGLPLLFPTPGKVFLAFLELIKTAEFYKNLLLSFARILSGILSAFLCGILLAALSHRFSFFRTLILPVMSVIKATPVASFIVLVMLWNGANLVPAIITFLIVLPVVWTNLDVGLSEIDKNLSEVAFVYRFSWFRKLRCLTIPEVLPYFLSAGRSALGLAWKAGIAAEILAMPERGIGTEIGVAKLYINTEVMFAWTLTVVFISLLIEFVFVRLFNRIPSLQSGKEVRYAER